MIGLDMREMWELVDSGKLVITSSSPGLDEPKGPCPITALNTRQLIDLIIQLITENNERIEQDLRAKH
uniref:Uncharacterized protein n=1 Tax=viral metagenome TaxID=1070528 RepID=A0A6M3M543_9ZZZZ